MALVWPPLSCFPAYLAVCVQLVFLGVLLLGFLLQLLRPNKNEDGISRNGHTTIYADDNHDDAAFTNEQPPPTTTKSSISTRTSIASTTLLLATHCFLLLTMLLSFMGYDSIISPAPDHGSRCSSGIGTSLSEIALVVSLAISLFAIRNVMKAKSTMFPWMLRAWWISGFLLSAVSVSLSTYLRTTYTGEDSKLGFLDSADILSLILSSFLFGVSVYGKTGIATTTFSASVKEPLLPEEGQSKPMAKSPYGNATIVELVTFSWLNPLFSVGIEKPLEQDDIPDVDTNESAAFISSAFAESLDRVTIKQRNRDNVDDSASSSSVYKAIFLLVRRKAALDALFAVASACASLVGPYLINSLVDFLSQKKNTACGAGM